MCLIKIIFICFGCLYSGLDIPAAVVRGQTPPPTKVSPPTQRVKTPSPIKTPLSQSPNKATPTVAPRMKSPVTGPRKSVISLGSMGSIGESTNLVRSPSPPVKAIVQPLPEIQITRTESNRSTVNEKLVKPEKIEEGRSNQIKCCIKYSNCNKNKLKFEFYFSDKTQGGAPKVVKRRAPAPNNDAADIAISRPIVTRVDHSKGMIPPPPLKTQAPQASTSAVKSESSPKPEQIPSDRPSTSRPTSPSPRKSPTPPPPKPLSSINSSFAPESMESVTGSSESLVKSTEPSLEANQAAVSPPSTLHPTRKVTDVTTIKRQPKTGWL